MNTLLKNKILFPLNFIYFFSPKTALKILFRIKNGYKLNLKDPKTFNEKIQWYKLFYKDPLIPKLVDKFTVRSFVSKRCPDLLVPILWEGFNVDDIPWSSLPKQFVVKITHGSGFNIICKDKNSLDIRKTSHLLRKWLKTRFLKCYGEWFYGLEKPRILIEEYLDNGTGKEPEDYKFLCFDGIARFVRVDLDRFETHKTNLYDTDWNAIDMTFGHPNGAPVKKPENLKKMIDYAEALSKGFPHVRVDLYNINGIIYFGELTFTTGAGFDRIRPYSFDVEMGKSFVLREYNEKSASN